MAGITGKNSLSVKKLDVAQSNVPAIGFNKIKFAHKATLSQTSILLTALTTPTEMTANGFVQPNLSVLSQLNLSQFRENFILRSSVKGVLVEYLSYVLVGAGKIQLLFPADENEIFEGTFDFVARTGFTLVDGAPLVSTGVLAIAATDFNVGTPFQVGKFSNMQVGAVMVFRENVLQTRNTGNNPPGIGITGDYYEVHAANGLGTIIRFNTPDLVNPNDITVVSVGSLIERPIGSQLALIEALSGQIDKIIPTLAALAGVPETDFQAAPNNVDLKAFGDRVLALENAAKNVVYIKDFKANNTGGGTSQTSYTQRDLNTVENPFSVTWVSLTANQFTLQPGKYLVEASCPAINVESHKAKLFNFTDSLDAILGTAAFANNSAGTDPSSDRSMIEGIITVATTPKVFELRHRAATSVAGGWGQAANFGDQELYSVVKITRLTD